MEVDAAAPLKERIADNRPAGKSAERWERRGSQAADARTSSWKNAARPAPINTSRNKLNKRGRDTHGPRAQQGARAGSPARKKATASGHQHEARTAGRDRSSVLKQESDQRESNLQQEAAKAKLDRRMGGMAPNGNPQCWFAPGDSETDQHRIAQRTKQVEYGKKSAGYQAYLKQVPKNVRKPHQPQTPDVRTSCSKRCFDGLLRAWRRRLHQYDPPEELEREAKRKESKAQPHGIVGVAAAKVQADAAAVEDMGPVPWEEIEKMSLATPRSWMDDDDSDISDPNSDDRVTIYTPELSPTPSELGKSGDMQSELWATPKSRLSPEPAELKDEGALPRTPPSPISPWGSALGHAGARTFADALRNEPAAADPRIEPPTLSQPALEPCSNSAEATLAPALDAGAAASGAGAPTRDEGPLTFGDAFATGVLSNAPSNSAARATFASLSPSAAPALPSAGSRAEMPSFTALQALEADNASISMRAFAAPSATAPGSSAGNHGNGCDKQSDGQQ